MGSLNFGNRLKGIKAENLKALNDMTTGEELNTIQKFGKLNKIRTFGDIGQGGAHHKFLVSDVDDDHKFSTIVCMQEGARNNEDSIHGLLPSDLLEIARFQLSEFQSGMYSTDDNAKAIEHIEIALMYMNKRTEDRLDRNVLGTMNK